jgi:hypothetical protein
LSVSLPYLFVSFLGAFATLRNATISFVMSARLHDTTRLLLDGFSWNMILRVYF